VSSSSPTVIVVGAGVIGCACAFELASAGARVSVFDSRRAGLGASQASAGVLAPFIEGHDSGPLLELGRRSLDLYDEFTQRVSASSGLTFQYTRSGTLEVALQGEEAVQLQRTGTSLTAQGVDARWLDRAALLQKEPLATPDAHGALFIAAHGMVGVPDFVDAMASAAMRAGATMALETRVVSIDRAPDGQVAVETENGRSLADQVVLAAGTWSGQVAVAGAAAAGVKPIRGQLLHLSWQTAQPLRHVLWSAHGYIVPWLNGRVLVGATVEDVGFEERATAEGVAALLKAGCDLVPQLWQASFTEVRVGLRPASTDGLPIIGRSSAVPGLVYAAGHYRNGVLLAPLTASLVRNLVFGRGDDPSLATVSPDRIGKL
jgi:glycine oxidase